jgi:molybdenum cofactor cytidylyltransferase
MAAGLSRRMGACKQLLPLDGKTVIDCCLETLLDGGISEVVVVVGPDGDAVADVAHNYPVRVVRISDPEGDMADSVRSGRDSLPPEVSGVMIALCDHPLVESATVKLLAALHREHQERIIIPVNEGRKGHPTLFPRNLLDELVYPLTLRDLVRLHPDRLSLVEVTDQGVRLDMDTPDDYRRISGLCRVQTRQLNHGNCTENASRRH